MRRQTYTVKALLCATMLITPIVCAQQHTKLNIEFPHPLITEVLFAVPTGLEGDANRDGVRDATGDEYVEIVNPHDKPISLKGYEISDWNAQFEESDAGWIVKLPDLTLEPGERAIIFNGLHQKWDGPVGDPAVAPKAKNEALGDAYVINSQNTSNYVGLNNTRDCVVLKDTGGTMIHVIAWEDAGKKKDDDKGIIESLTIPASCFVETIKPVRRQSVERKHRDSPLVPHGDRDGLPCSPGQWPAPAK
ncbi:MAG: lamin tail domain-containing protein [Phycisphaeraceae bacterium]|nr:lamin tail domain-containing protein [Phycisphaeraceae bacterium]